MSKQVNYNENLCSGAAIRDDKGRRISKLFEASHPKMTVGYAKNLIMPDTPTEQEFNFRQSGGGVIEDGVAVIDKVKGNSVVWNQLIKDFREPSNWLTGGNDVTTVGDKIHIKFASASSSNAFGVKSSAFSAGHKYCLLMNNENAMPLTAIKLGSASSIGSYGSTLTPETPAITIAIPTSSESDGALWFWPSDETKLEGDFSNIYAIDLTQMFGAGNEPTTYEEFLSRKPKVADEYAYNEGTIVNNKMEKVVTTGRNLFNPNVETEYLAVTGKSGSERYVKRLKALPGTYFIKSINNESVYAKSVINGVYGSARALNSNVTITLDSDGEIWVYSETEAKINNVANDICINLSDPTINGKYFPYEEHELDLSWVKDIKDADGVKLFEDGMKSAGTAFDEAAKGRAIKRVGVVDMGKITWHKRDDISPSMFASYGVAPNNKIGLCPIASINKNQYDATLVDGALYWMENYVMMYNSKFTTIDDFVNFVSGTPIYYKLAEPIEVEYDEKNLTYPVVAGGTEEAIASEPSTAFRADIGYGIDAVKTILDLKARVEALEGK